MSSGAGVVAPSREDPVVGALSESVGGPSGRRLRAGPALIAVLVLVGMSALTGAVGLALKAHCRGTGWGAANPDQYVHLCYSDIPLLYGPRGIAAGEVPYLSDAPVEEQVEYPVLTGAAMWFSGLFVDDRNDTTTRQRYFDVNVLFLTLCAAATAAVTALTVPHRRWDAALVALAPGIAVAGTINWDLLAVALTAGGMWAWARSRPVAAGLLLGLATAAKFYPLLLLGPLLLLCLRAGRLKAYGSCLGAAALAWLAVNVPVMVLAWDGGVRFYELSSERGAGYGSPWLSLSFMRAGVPDERLNTVAAGSFVLCCAGIAALILFARRRPRFAQVAFLVVAAFLLTNKVYSPQYVVWLVPLAAMARPRWGEFLVWQVFEVLHWMATWLYLAGSTADPPRYDRALPVEGYNIAVGLHMLATAWYMALVVRDVLRPAYDVVRADGSDDPGGGVLDGADDVPLRPRSRDREGSAVTV